MYFMKLFYKKRYKIALYITHICFNKQIKFLEIYKSQGLNLVGVESENQMAWGQISHKTFPSASLNININDMTYVSLCIYFLKRLLIT